MSVNKNATLGERFINYIIIVTKLINISESVRGCYPKNQTLPGLSGSLIPPRSRCSFLPRRRSPVKVNENIIKYIFNRMYNVI